MNDGLSVGNDQSGSDSIDAANDAASSAISDSRVDDKDTRSAPEDLLDGMRAVADQLRGQIGVNNASPSLPDESNPQTATTSVVSTGYADRAKTLDDIELENELRNNEAQLLERKEQLHLAEQTERNAGAIADGLGLVAGIAGLGDSLARGIASVAASFGISVGGEQVIEAVVGNSGDIAFNEVNRLEARVRTLKAEQQRRIDEPPTSGREVEGPIPERPEVTESLPEQIEAERNTASVEREKQRQFENIAASDPAFRDQALQEAANSADKAAAAEQRADALQQQQDQRVNELAAAEEQRAAREVREQRRQEQDDRSEPNGGQVGNADPGVGRNDVPDSF